MDTMLPLGLPWPTAFYVTLYILTLVIHVVFMNYVLAGSAYLALCGVRLGASLPKPSDDTKSPIAIVLDWLPVMLSGAITAGVAPLLFLQILYRESFYTANLLLFHRWMSLLPVLIVGFYALYLLRGSWLRRRPFWLVSLVATLPFLCFAFTAYSWTENHLLAARDRASWAEFYGTGRLLYTEPQLVPRLLVWALGSLPTFALVLGWQLYYHAQRGRTEAATSARTVATLALIGFVLTLGGAIAYGTAIGEKGRDVFLGPMAKPYLLTALGGAGLQALLWIAAWIAGMWSKLRLILTSVGLGLSVVSLTFCREAMRLATMGQERLDELMPLHAQAFDIGGQGVFLFFLLVNMGTVALCFVLVRRGKQGGQEPRGT